MSVSSQISDIDNSSARQSNDLGSLFSDFSFFSSDKKPKEVEEESAIDGPEVVNISTSFHSLHDLIHALHTISCMHQPRCVS